MKFPRIKDIKPDLDEERSEFIDILLEYRGHESKGTSPTHGMAQYSGPEEEVKSSEDSINMHLPLAEREDAISDSSNKFHISQSSFEKKQIAPLNEMPQRSRNFVPKRPVNAYIQTEIQTVPTVQSP